MSKIYVDADACPVKAEVMRVAHRHKIDVIFVANSHMRLPEQWKAKLKIVENQLDAADNWIVEQLQTDDIVVTTDIPLADRAIKVHARALNSQGLIYSTENIGDVLATRNLMSSLRESGEVMGGPTPFQKKDRSRFLEVLEQIVQDVKRR